MHLGGRGSRTYRVSARTLGYIETPVPLQIQKQAFWKDQVMLKGQHIYHTGYTYSKDLTWARWLQNWPWHSTSLSIQPTIQLSWFFWAVTLPGKQPLHSSPTLPLLSQVSRSPFTFSEDVFNRKAGQNLFGCCFISGHVGAPWHLHAGQTPHHPATSPERRPCRKWRLQQQPLCSLSFLTVQSGYCNNLSN